MTRMGMDMEVDAYAYALGASTPKQVDAYAYALG